MGKRNPGQRSTPPRPVKQAIPPQPKIYTQADFDQNGVTVEVENSSERWSEFKLKDGSTLRIKPIMFDVSTIEGARDAEGKPVYAIRAGHVIDVVPQKD